MKKLLFALTFTSICFVIGGCDSSTAVNPCDVQIGAHSAVTAVAQKVNRWWMPRHLGVQDRIAEGNVNIIFIGDSITHFWDREGKDVWQNYYAPRGAVNMGFSGDRTQHVLWRLENGEIDNISPRLAVIMIGTNNSHGTDHTSEEIADGIKAIVCKLRTDLPQTKVLILAIFPRRSREQYYNRARVATYNPQWQKNDKANELVSQVADNEMIYYLDINGFFLNDEGVLTREVMPDLVHPREKGYQIWAEAMEPTIKKLLDE